MKLSAHNFGGFNKCHVFAAQGKGRMGLKLPPRIAAKIVAGVTGWMHSGDSIASSIDLSAENLELKH